MALGADEFRDAIAFARAVVNSDWEGGDAILAAHDTYLDIMVPMAWVIRSLVDSIALERQVPVDMVWNAVLESIEITEGEINGEGSGD